MSDNGTSPETWDPAGEIQVRRTSRTVLRAALLSGVPAALAVTGDTTTTTTETTPFPTTVHTGG